MKFSCLLNSYDSGNSLIGTSVTLGRDSVSRQYTPAQADTTYAMYVAISNGAGFSGDNVLYEQKQEYALKFKSADYTFSNFVCNNAEVSTKKGTVASVAKGTNADYTKDYIVEDERDNKYYIVRKLYMRANDGTISTACWMTQNLDLDLVAQYESGNSTAAIYAYNRENNTKTKLTTTNSDLTNAWTTASNINSSMLYASNNGTNGRSQNWYASYKFTTIANGASPVFPTTTTTSSNSRVTPSGNHNPDNNPGMLDPGNIMFGPFDSTLSLSYTPVSNPDVTTSVCETNDTKCFQFRNTKYFATEVSGHIISGNAIGNYYNWYAATAGTGNSSITTDGTNVQGSVCPKGWGLAIGRVTNNGFGKVMSAYFPTAGVVEQNGTVYKIGNNYSGFASMGGLKSNSDNMITDTPLSFMRADGIVVASDSGRQGINVNYWTATSDTVLAYILFTESGALYPGNNGDYRGYAKPMRCVQGI